MIDLLCMEDCNRQSFSFHLQAMHQDLNLKECLSDHNIFIMIMIGCNIFEEVINGIRGKDYSILSQARIPIY
jgi:hypothetical protein